MKIAVVTCGTRGDVQPMAALTLGLNAAGHQAVLFGPPENEAWAMSVHCPFRSMGAPVRGNPTLKAGGLGALARFVRQEVGAQTRQLADEVQAFLDAGPPPVYVGFGSMPVAHPERMGALLRQAARTTGRRFIVCGGWSAVDAGAGRGDSLFVDDVPHALLFPRVAAVVHHGGSGTVATTARAGVPQVVFPSSSASGTSGTGGKRGDRRCDPNDRRRRADRAGGRGD